jgi:hypothetical protein
MEAKKAGGALMLSKARGSWLLIFSGLLFYLYGWWQVEGGETIPRIMTTLGVEEPVAGFPWTEMMDQGLLAFLGGGLAVSLGVLLGVARIWQEKRKKPGFWVHFLWTILPALVVLLLAGPALRLFIAFLATGGIIAWLFQTPVSDKGIY